MNLYLRLILVLFGLIGLPRRGLLEESRISFRVLPNDCDINGHLNNGRYLSFMDLGRLHLVAQIGLLRVILRRRWLLCADHESATDEYSEQQEPSLHAAFTRLRNRTVE